MKGVAAIVIALLALCAVDAAHAADAANAICLDTDGNGTYDTIWPAGVTDRDCDGYSGSLDPDDTDPRRYPGAYHTVGCSAGQYKLVNADGSETSCTSGDLAPAATTYYVDEGSGNDSNAGTSSGAAYKSMAKLCDYDSAGSRPAGWRDLGPDTAVVFIGTTDHTSTYNAGATTGNTFCFLTSTQSGNSGSRTLFIQDPRSTAKITPSAGAAFRATSGSYFKFQGMEITARNIQLADGGSDSQFVGMNMHDVVGVSDGINDNTAAITFTRVDRSVIRNSRFWDVYDPDFFVENTSGTVYFEGDDHQVLYSQVGYTNAFSYGGIVKGQGFKYKHGKNLGATYDFLVEGSRGYQVSRRFVATAQRHTKLKRNFVLNSQALYECGDLGGGNNQNHCDDQLVEYNTFVSSVGGWNLIEYDLDNDNPGTLTVRNNVYVDANSSYSDGGIVRIIHYGTNSQYNSYLPSGPPGSLSFNNNCYYNTLGTTKYYSLFGDTGSGNLGFRSTIANWQSNGLDTTSYEEDPALSAYQVPSSTHCSSNGASIAAGATPTPTPTATATPTATPTPAPTAVPAARQNGRRGR